MILKMNESVQRELETIQATVDLMDDHTFNEYYEQIVNERDSYNEALKNMIELARKYISDEMTKEELAESIKEPISKLREQFTKYNLKEPDEHEYELSSSEITNLRAVLVGAYEIVRKRRKLEP